MLPAIIGAVAGPLLGGIFGKKNKPQVTTSYVDYERMVKDATAAGFNPLTALRNGGAAGFSTSTTTGGALSQPSFMSSVGDALAAGINAWANYDELADEQRKAEYDLVMAQLEGINLNNQALRKQSLGDAPMRASAGSVTVSTNSQSGEPASTSTAPDGLPQPIEAGDRTATNPWKVFTIDPKASDGAVFEERYGDFMGGLIGGTAPLVADIKHNLDRGLVKYTDWATKGYDAHLARRNAARAKRTGGGGAW